MCSGLSTYALTKFDFAHYNTGIAASEVVKHDGLQRHTTDDALRSRQGLHVHSYTSTLHFCICCLHLPGRAKPCLAFPAGVKSVLRVRDAVAYVLGSVLTTDGGRAKHHLRVRSHFRWNVLSQPTTLHLFSFLRAPSGQSSGRENALRSSEKVVLLLAK